VRAMVLHEPKPAEENPLRLEDVPVPEPGDREIRVKITYCGVCHTDLHTVEGEIKAKLPVIPGHEIVGVVDKKGKNANRFEMGERVGIAWLNYTCGECEYCKKGMENLCPNARFTGFHVNGGYAEYTIIHEDFAYKIPSLFPDEHAPPLLCAGIVGYRAYKLTEPRRGDKLAIFGFGASAAIAIQIAIYMGLEVYVFTRNPERRKLAEFLGASWTGDYNDTPPSKYERCVVYTPAGWMVPVALEHLKPGGVVSLGGIYMTEIPSMDYERHLYYEKKLLSTTAATRKDGEELMELAGKIPIRTHTQVFGLEEANEVLKILKKRQLKATGVLKI